jgi:hypothetical protein
MLFLIMVEESANITRFIREKMNYPLLDSILMGKKQADMKIITYLGGENK